jgi:hypothetical protein
VALLLEVISKIGKELVFDMDKKSERSGYARELSVQRYGMEEDRRDAT